MSISDRLAQLRRALPRRKGAFLYSAKQDLERSAKRIKIYAVLISEENTVMLSHIVVKKDRPHSVDWWRAWCSLNVVSIFKAGVLPGLNLRTAKAWHVSQWLGFSLTTSPSNAVLTPSAPTARRARHRANKKKK